MENNKNDPEYRLEVISDSPTFYLLIVGFSPTCRLRSSAGENPLSAGRPTVAGIFH